ncbi:transglycosylase domain-containing protein [Isoptericola sp. NEAU-Y5]|uniref:Transglycosylase domain-containing protein n=1 Tax=Isoptericola luteus TaxID=2879484 RepID=A0ABS7ZIP0_9MICO|nr:transglycosylase domain-containing protein [Isoptericola sp. NEAU-Y5]MCA5894382.1 transglycosylase domain-containing protein [Isoptericola sp. NEAU-Y5]
MANQDPRRITRTMPATQLVALLLAFVLAAVAGGVLTAGLVIPFAAGVNAAADSTVEIYDELPAELEPSPLSQQSRIYASNGKLLATFYAQNRIVVSLDEVSEPMKNAVIAIEDERFWEHGGIDTRGMTRALANNLSGDATQGASTLTQQYVKNMLIEQALQDDDPFGVIEAKEDTVNRKLREAKMAISLEQKMSKEDILQGYLNVAQFGKNQIYGVETAAQYYFSKHAKDLNVVEAATIAGITKSPARFDPTANPDDALERRNLVLHKMWSLGYITTQEYDEAKALTIKESLDVTPVEVGCSAAKKAEFFCDYVTKEIVLNPVFGETKGERQDLLYKGGLEIHTTLDMKLQKKAVEVVKEAVAPGDASGLQSAIASVEPGTGEIRAMAQNIPYTPAAGSDKLTTRVNYAADPLHGASGGFQVGSNFKPFVLAEWLKEGHTLNERVTANKVSRVVGTFNTPCIGSLGGDVWEPGNAEGVAYGSISALQATYESVNTAYASMGFELNLCSLRSTAWDMGFRPTRSSDNDGAVVTTPEEDSIDIAAPMVLGTQESTPLYQAAAYATLASGGTYCEPIAITSVTGPDGEELEVPGTSCDKNALPTNIANTVVFAMEKVFSGTGTARRLGGLADGRPVAGKTGTSNASAQTWFTGFTPNLSTSVWVGNADKPNEDHTNGNVVNGQFHRVLYGSTLAAPAWKKFMDTAIQDLPVKDFGAPDQSLIGAPPKAPPPDDSDDDSGDDKGNDKGNDDKGDDDKGRDDKPGGGGGSDGSPAGTSSANAASAWDSFAQTGRDN